MANSPERTKHGELPITSFVDWDRVAQFRRILIELEYGQLYSGALLADAMMRDDRVFGSTSTRLNGLTGTPVVLEAAKDTALGRKVAAEATLQWPNIFPVAATQELHRWGLYLSLGVAQNIWADIDGQWLPRLKIWHPSACRWDWNERRFYLNTMGGQLPLPDTDAFPNSDGTWVLYTPYGYRGFLRGIIRALGMPYLSRMWATRDWNRQNEIHGIAIRKARVPSDAAQTDKDSFFEACCNIGNETVLELPFAHGDKEGGFDLELLEAMANNWQGFEKLLEKAEGAIDVLLLGHTGAAGGGNATVYGPKNAEDVRADYLEADATGLAGCYQAQTLYWWAKYNYGDGSLAPKPVYQTTPPQNTATAAQALLNLSLASSNFVAVSAPVDYRQMLDRYGVPLLNAGEKLQLDPPVVAPKPGSAEPPPAPSPPTEK